MEYQYETGRIFAMNEAGDVIAEITFPAKDGVATIDHTFVDSSLRGQGVAGELMRRAVEQIRKDGSAVAATCSYAVAWLEKHPEIPSIPSGDGPACRIDGRH